jgi:DNA polymerase III epsilon subunit-like protein
MKQRRYFLFDTETGGLDARSISLLSFFGLVLDQNLNIVDNINLDIRPNDGRYHVDIEALKVNQINLVEHHEKAIPESEASKKLAEFLFRNSSFLSDPSNKLIPAGHNIGRLDIPMGERLIGFDEWDRLFCKRTIDTGTIAQFMILKGTLPETNNCSLKQLCEHFKIDYVNAHNAKQDVFMALEVLKAMVRDGTVSLCPTPLT